MSVLLLAGCGAAEGSASAKGNSAVPAPDASAAQSGDVAVGAVDNSFRAETVTVTAGSKVTWSNAGRNDHNVKPVDGGEFGVDAADFKPGASYSATFATAGTYRYYCSIHGTKDRGMVGTVEVVQ